MTHQRIAFASPELIERVTHPKLTTILETIPGFDEILASAQAVSRPIEPPVIAGSVDFARRLIDGEDPNDLAAEYARLREDRADFVTAGQHIVDAAQSLHDQHLREFLDTHRADILDGIAAQYRRIVEAVRSLLPELEHVRSGEDLAEHPEAAPAYAQFVGYVRSFDEWRGLQRFHAALPEGGVFPDLVFLRNLPEVAPDFWERKDNRTSCWPNTQALLRDLATRNPAFWVPTAEQLATERARVTSLAEAKRASVE